jgi:N-acetylglucosamine kinase-like BadF-type ATPase
VAASTRAFDEAGAESGGALIEGIMKSWGVTTHEQFVVAANKSPDFAALLPAVLSAAEAGDATARIVLTQAGRELATLAGIVIARLFGKRRAVPVAVSGGVFGNSAVVRQVFGKRVRAACLRASLNTTVVDPVKGALALARKNA